MVTKDGYKFLKIGEVIFMTCMMNCDRIGLSNLITHPILCLVELLDKTFEEKPP